MKIRQKPQNTTLQGTPQLYLPFVVAVRSAPSSNCSVGHGGAPELSRSAHPYRHRQENRMMMKSKSIGLSWCPVLLRGLT